VRVLLLDQELRVAGLGQQCIEGHHRTGQVYAISMNAVTAAIWSICRRGIGYACGDYRASRSEPRR
jgi:hypothetical protein